MINANLEQFLDTGWYNEATLYYNGYIYWCEGSWDMSKEKPMHFVVYRFPAIIINDKYYERIETSDPYEYVYDIWGSGEADVKEEFLQAKIFEGKSFWEVERELGWYEE